MVTLSARWPRHQSVVILLQKINTVPVRAISPGEIMPHKVLAVDDDLSMLRVIALALAVDGYQVVTAQSAEAARAILCTQQIALCLMDINLPDANGRDLITEFRAAYARPIIILTGMAADTIPRDDDFIAKPFRISDLWARVRAALHP